MKNPTVFVIIGNSLNHNEFLEEARRVYNSGEFFYLENDNVRSLKAEILENKSGLCLNRVNIYVACSAECVQGAEMVSAMAEHLAEVFREDFSIVFIALVAILNESDDCENYEERRKTTYKFLSELNSRGNLALSSSRAGLIFSQVFLLSNKNERGEILKNNQANETGIFVGLPLIHQVDSSFCDIMAARQAKQEGLLFASAGFWQKDSSEIEKNIALHKLAEILENILEATDHRNNDFSPGQEFHSDGKIQSQFSEIAQAISHIACKPTRFWKLCGLEIKEAENILFGKEAERFFNRVYANEKFGGQFEKPAEIDDTPIPEKAELRQIVACEIFLRNKILQIEQEISTAKNRLAQQEACTCKINPWIIAYAINAIGENYALKYKILSLQEYHAKISAEHGRLKNYLDYLRGIIEKLKALPAAEAAPKAMGDAVIAIFLLRDDGLIRENHILQKKNGENCLLRILGGFTLQDLRRWL